MTKIKGGFTVIKTAIMGISAPVVAIVAVIAILVVAFKHLWETNEDFRNNIIAIWDGIKTTFERLTSGIVDRLNALDFSFSDITEIIKAVWDVFCNYLAPIFENTFKYIGDILSDAVDVILGIVDFFIGLFTEDWETCWNGIKEIFTGIWDAIKSNIETFLELICNIFNTNLADFCEAWEAGWNDVKDFFADVWTSMPNSVRTAMNTIQNSVLRVWDNVHSGVWDRIWRIRNMIADGLNSSADCTRNLVN